MELNKRIFDTLNEIREMYKLDVKLPQSIPEGCNIIGYECCDLGDIDFYKETSDELLWYSYQGVWKPTGNLSLNGEVTDDISNEHEYVYLRVDRRTKFTPERLLGVETKSGYVTDVHFTKDFEPQIVTVQICNKHLYHPCSLRYYISDDSDDTVSFAEYVDLFYERE